MLDQATPSLLILTTTGGRGEVVDSNVTWKSKRKQLIIKTAVKYILHLFQQCEISEKELNIVDPVGAGPSKETVLLHKVTLKRDLQFKCPHVTRMVKPVSWSPDAVV